LTRRDGSKPEQKAHFRPGANEPDGCRMREKRIWGAFLSCFSQRQSFMFKTMDGRHRHRAWSWLLCALLFWLTTNPPHCDLCDGVSFTVASAQGAILKHSHPVAPDNCNGICTCCGFYGLPRVEQALVPLNAAPARVVPESPRPAFAPRSTIFRPPRIVAS
jgi:hypothetical protein